MLLTILFITISSCFQGKKRGIDFDLANFGEPDSLYEPLYSKGFKIFYFGSDKIVEVLNPWDENAPSDLFFIDNTGLRNVSGLPIIKAPVTNWSAFSSSQVVMADKLDVIETLKSVADPEYISNHKIKEGVISGTVKNAGTVYEPDIETLIVSQPQFIFVSTYKENHYDRLNNVGLITIPDAGYLETVPLGRAEWIIFFGAFFNLEEEAKKIFKEVEISYNETKAILSEIIHRPTVTTGFLYQDIWFVPAGDSYIATLFRDAGADYPYSDTKGTGSLGFDFEKVFFDTYQSDFWMFTVNHPGNFTYADFQSMDARYAQFKAFKENKIIYSNTYNSGYYEWGWMEPHTILKDLGKAFHPALFADHKPIFFTILQP